MPIRSRFVTLGLSAALALSLSACVNQPRREYRPAPHYQSQGYPERQGYEYGTVAYIETVPGRDAQTTGGGAALGAVIGGVLGHQVGKGGGRTAATVAGVVGGALAGNAIEERNSRAEADHYRVVVRLDRGGERVYDVPNYGDLRRGDRVRLRGGEIARM